MKNFIESLQDMATELDKNNKDKFIALRHGAYLYAFGKKNIKFFVQFACFEKDQMRGIQYASISDKLDLEHLHDKIMIVAAS